MNEKQQITYMQARIIRLASEKWNVPVKEIGSIFTEFRVFRFIRDCFELFHVEGDEAVLEEVGSYLAYNGGQNSWKDQLTKWFLYQEAIVKSDIWNSNTVQSIRILDRAFI